MSWRCLCGDDEAPGFVLRLLAIKRSIDPFVPLLQHKSAGRMLRLVSALLAKGIKS